MLRGFVKGNEDWCGDDGGGGVVIVIVMPHVRSTVGCGGAQGYGVDGVKAMAFMVEMAFAI